MFSNHLAMFEQFNEIPSQSFDRVMLSRTSGHNSDPLCEHCEHQHALKCCMYLYDDVDDIIKYALFKKEVDEPYWTMNQSEDFDMTIGSITPKNFPCFSINDPEEANRAALANIKPPPMIYIRQYFWPLFLPSNQQLPIESINQYTNPLDIKHPLSNCYGNVYQQQYANPYQPIIMRQLTIPQAVDCNSPSSQHPKIIESHSFIPVHYGHQFNWGPL